MVTIGSLRFVREYTDAVPIRPTRFDTGFTVFYTVVP